MLPLLPIALDLIPRLVEWIGGDQAGKTATAAANVVRAATGTDDEEQARAVIAADPKLAADLKIKLAEIVTQARQAERQADLEVLKAQLGDVTGARTQTVQLAGLHNASAYGSMTLSGIILVGFAMMLFIVLDPVHLQAAQSPIANVLLGTLAAMATQVANYWLGSSQGSRAKDASVQGLQEALANSVPASVVGRMS